MTAVDPLLASRVVNRASRNALLRLKAAVRPIARRVGLAKSDGAWWESNIKPWTTPTGVAAGAHAVCNICHWSGDEFVRPYHSEMADCPQCGSVARDRFLLLCFLSRTRRSSDLRVLETSPRMGHGYRELMRRWFDYTASDYDLSAHQGDIQIDLQNIALPDESIDVLLTPHVLEHVPDTDRALREIFRVLKPGGRMYLQVPMLIGATTPPATPEFHGDNTPVFFNFGWDLIDRLRGAGFDTKVLVTDAYRDILQRTAPTPDSIGDGFDIAALVEKARPEFVVGVADDDLARVYGFLPSHHYSTFECIKP